MFQSKQEKEKLVIDLYSQGKTYRQIAEKVRISPNDIHAKLTKKEEEENDSTVTNHQQQSSLFAAKAYVLFSKGKTPVQVSVALNLREPKVARMFLEYCRLRRLHLLYSVYKETNGKLSSFLILYKELIKKKGMSVEQVANAVDIAIHKLP
jgi:hypothetical protein